MTTSDKGIVFITSWEKLELEAYQDSKGVWTIGYGTTIYPMHPNHSVSNHVKKGDICTIEEAQFWFRQRLTEIETWLTRTFPYFLQNKFDAIVSFIYNVGLYAYEHSSLIRHIENHFNCDLITVDFDKYEYSAHIKVLGLFLRRQAEAKIFCEGVYINHN